MKFQNKKNSYIKESIENIIDSINKDIKYEVDVKIVLT
jgi:3-methyladenine DNA glycosylase AlkC